MFEVLARQEGVLLEFFMFGFKQWLAVGVVIYGVGVFFFTARRIRLSVVCKGW